MIKRAVRAAPSPTQSLHFLEDIRARAKLMAVNDLKDTKRYARRYPLLQR